MKREEHGEQKSEDFKGSPQKPAPGKEQQDDPGDSGDSGQGEGYAFCSSPIFPKWLPTRRKCVVQQNDTYKEMKVFRQFLLTSGDSVILS